MWLVWVHTDVFCFIYRCYCVHANVRCARMVPGLVRLICASICAMVSGFGSFDSIGRILMVSTLSSTISMSHPVLGMSVHMLDLFSWFPQPFSSSERCLAFRLGESGGLPLFRGVLTLFGVFAGLFTSVSTPGMSECPFNTPA